MSSRSSKFIIGLFVITGVMMCVVIIIWVGAADLFMKGSTYVTYFDESVQGLQADSAVKYRGVEIGKVQSIKVAPDYRLIEVAMKIDLSADLQYNATAQLRTLGITGIVFIELDRLKKDDRSTSPVINFKTVYPVIPSPSIRPSISSSLPPTNARVKTKFITRKWLLDTPKSHSFTIPSIPNRMFDGLISSYGNTYM